MRSILATLSLIVLVCTLGCSHYDAATKTGTFVGSGAVTAYGLDTASDMCTGPNGQPLPCSMMATKAANGSTAVSVSNGGYYGYPYGASVPYVPGLPMGSTGNHQLDGVMLYRATHPVPPVNQVANDLAAAGVYQTVRQGDLTQAAVAGNTAAVYDLRANVAGVDATVQNLEHRQTATEADVTGLETDLNHTAALTSQGLRELATATADNRRQVDGVGNVLRAVVGDSDEPATVSDGPAGAEPFQIKVEVPYQDAAEEE